MDLEQIREDFKQGKMISKCTWALVLEAARDMDESLQRLSKASGLVGQFLTADEVLPQVDVEASDCLGRVAAL